MFSGFLKVQYLGHIMSEKGVFPDPDKLEATERFPVPTAVKPLRAFLGFVGYYRSLFPKFHK